MMSENARNSSVGPANAKDLVIKQILNEALQHHGAGRLSEAEHGYHEALKIDPDHAGAIHLLGVIAHQTGKNDVAVDLINKAIRLKPDYTEAYCNLGLALRELKRLDEAVDSYDKALTLKPDAAEIHFNRGITLRDQGKLDDAAAGLQRSIDQNNNNPSVHFSLGLTLKERGHLDAAITSLRTAIRLKPDFGEAHRHLAVIKTHDHHDDDIRAMEDAYGKPGLADAQKLQLAFGLGKAFDDLHQYDRAFDYFATGNAIRRQAFNYSTADSRRTIDTRKSVFGPARFEKHADAGHQDEAPIFIVGMPRSGTTLVEQILASHPQVYGAGELNTLQQLVSGTFSSKDPDAFTHTVDNADNNTFTQLGSTYLSAIRAIRNCSSDARFIVDKMPDNYLNIGIIKLALPGAKIIHCRRNPLDNGLSLFKSYFPVNAHFYAYDLAEIGRHYTLYNDLTEHWHHVLPGCVFDVSYEDMVRDQEAQTRALLDYCHLPWDEACLQFHKTDRAVQTASAVQVRQPLYDSSIQSWKAYEPHLAPLIEALAQKPGI